MNKALTKKEFEKQKNRLLREQKHLITRLKVENEPVYNWFIARGIDFSDLSKRIAGFSAAATLLLSLAPNRHINLADYSEPLPAEEIPSAEPAAKKKNDLQRGQEVWAQYGQLIREAGAKYDVDPNLIFATIMIESGGNPKAIRHEPRINDASYGLGQILYGTARGLGYRGTAEGLYNPAVNIELIAIYHRHNLDRYGHLTAQQLTTAYNTGSPYKKPLAGHLNKFNKWYNRIENLEIEIS